jgi:hypothetical protein
MFIPLRMVSGVGGQQHTLYVRGIQLTARQLQAFEHEAADMTVPFTEVAGDMRAQVEAAFGSQGATGASGRWTALSEPYRTFKQDHVPGIPILVGLHPRSKRTRNSPRTPAQTYAPSGQMRLQMLDPLATYVSPRRLLYAPRSDIAGFHETGTEKMPARPPLDLSLTFLHSIDRAFARWLAVVIKREGL